MEIYNVYCRPTGLVEIYGGDLQWRSTGSLEIFGKAAHVFHSPFLLSSVHIIAAAELCLRLRRHSAYLTPARVVLRKEPLVNHGGKCCCEEAPVLVDGGRH